MDNIVKIGIYGGTFDPFHDGHKQVIKNILDAKLVDKIRVVPCRQNPLKGHKPSDNYKRINQISKEIEEFGYKCSLETSELHSRKEEPSYTYDTLNNMMYRDWSHNYGRKIRYDYYLIIGVDEWNVFKQWKNYDWILKNVDILVHPRPGIEPEWEHYRMTYLKDFEAKNLSSSRIRLDEFIEGLKSLNIGEDLRVKQKREEEERKKIEYQKNIDDLIKNLQNI